MQPAPHRKTSPQLTPLSKCYEGYRADTGCHVLVIEDTGMPGLTAIRQLDMRIDLRSHSVTGPEWGFAGSAPAQLALALAADVLGDDQRALQVYQELKWSLVARLPHEGWQLSGVKLRVMIERILRGDDVL